MSFLPPKFKKIPEHKPLNGSGTGDLMPLPKHDIDDGTARREAHTPRFYGNRSGSRLTVYKGERTRLPRGLGVNPAHERHERHEPVEFPQINQQDKVNEFNEMLARHANQRRSEAARGQVFSNHRPQLNEEESTPRYRQSRIPANVSGYKAYANTYMPQENVLSRRR